MAKKKVADAQHDKPSQKPLRPPQETPPSTMESDKIENLKNLNQMLLKEAVQRRQQVDSLLQSKGSLEMELTRSNSEREALESELARLVDRAAVLEVERVVVAVFVAVQVGVKGEEFCRDIKGLEMGMREWQRANEEKESEIARLDLNLSVIENALVDERDVSRRLLFERDGFQEKLDRQIKEDEGLRANLSELDGKMKELEREIDELRAVYNAVAREKQDMEMKIKMIMREKDFSERDLMDSNELIEKMKEEISVIVQERERVEKEKNDEIKKRQDLENVVSQLNEMVANLKEEEVKRQKVVIELEKNCVAGEEKLKEIEREIDRLFEETKLSEKEIQALVAEKSVMEKNLDDAMEQVAKQKMNILVLSKEKTAILEAKNRVDGEVGVLQNHVHELKAAVLGLEESNLADVENVRRLESEVRNCKLKLDEVFTERDGLGRSLNEEKQNGSGLKEKIQELEKKMEDSQQAAAEVKAENAAILTEKVELERRCEVQREEIASLQEWVVKARAELDSMKSKVELSDANAMRVLDLLKGTSAFCSREGQGHSLAVDGEELKGHVMEVEVIKDAFKNKAAKVEEMERQLECLQSSVVHAEKRKSFWAMLSSATTVMAAVSLAYVARGH